MRQLIDRLLRSEAEGLRGPVTIAPSPSKWVYENDLAIEVQHLSIEQYMLHLCRLITREGQNPALRLCYETMLRQLQPLALSEMSRVY
jgi:hypothetical protein